MKKIYKLLKRNKQVLIRIQIVIPEFVRTKQSKKIIEPENKHVNEKNQSRIILTDKEESKIVSVMQMWDSE